MMVGIERALEGKAADDELSVELAASETFGEFVENAHQRISVKHLQGAKKWQPGMTAVLQTDKGAMEVSIVKVGKFMATVDTNHPMGGRTLNFDLKVESVRDARRREVLNSRRMFSEITEDGVVWDDGSEEQFDAIVWCTGFKPNLSHLESMDVVKNNRIRSNGTKSVDIPGLLLLGYGNWTGFASATIYGVGKTARDTAKQIESYYQTIVDSSSE